MKKAIIYTRFSDRPDADTSESCDFQKDYCSKWCKDNDYDVQFCFEDRAISGTAPIDKRPGLRQALSCLEKDMVIVIYHWDRLARDRMVHVSIESYVIGRGGDIVSASTNSTTKDESPEDELTRTILQSLSAYDRQLRAIRTSNAMRSHQSRGRIMSKHLPYGFKVNPDESTQMIECAAEQKVLKAIETMRKEGSGYMKIAKELDKANIKPRNSEKWNKGVVRNIILRLERDA